MIRDETNRVRQPAALLLIGGVATSVFGGLMAMLSTSWAAGLNPGTLGVVVAGGTAGPGFGDRSVVASHVFTAIPVTAMAVAAVILATHIGEKVRLARRITLYAVVLQAVALFFGVITWLVSLGVPHGAAKLAFFLDGAVGIMVAAAGLYFSLVTLRSRELQRARTKATKKAPQATAYQNYGYGQQGTYPAAGYPPGSAQQAGRQTTAQQTSAQGQQFQGGAASQQYGSAAAQQYGQTQTPGQAQGAYGQHSYGAYGQQAYSPGYSQPSHQQNYDPGYGQQQPYAQGYGAHTAAGYGQQPAADPYQRTSAEAYQQPSTDAYPQPSAESYQQYYQQRAQPPAERASSDSSQPGPGLGDEDSRDLR